MITALFVGSNPSNASMLPVAFHGSTKSSKILTEWCNNLKCHKIHINVSDSTTKDNRALTQTEIQNNLESLKLKVSTIEATKVVALGKTAAKALTAIGVAYYEMPHPSGRNRKLNDKKYVAEKVKGLVAYCSEPALITNTDEVLIT